MEELLGAKKDPVLAMVIQGSTLSQKQTSIQHLRTVPSSVGYIDPSEVSWSQNTDSAASMFSPSLSVWEETFMDLKSVCAMEIADDMVGDIKHTSSTVADDELNTPIIGNEFSFNPIGAVSRDVISPAPCLNFGNVSDSWRDLHISPSSVSYIEEGAQKEPFSVSDINLNFVQDSGVTVPLQDENMTLIIPEMTSNTSGPINSIVKPYATNIKNKSVPIFKTEHKPIVVKSFESHSTSVPCIQPKMQPIASSSEDKNTVQQVTKTSEGTQGTSPVSEKQIMTQQKDGKRKELKLNLAAAWLNVDDISTPVVFSALDADGSINLMDFIDNDNYSLTSPNPGLETIQYIIAEAEEEEIQSDAVEQQIQSTVQHVGNIFNDSSANCTAEEITHPVQVEYVTSVKVNKKEEKKVEVWQVKEEDDSPQSGLKLKILKQKINESKKLQIPPKQILGKRTSNRSDDCYEDDDDEYFPNKKSKTVQRKRLTSASSSSSTTQSPGTSRTRSSSTAFVSDIEEKYRELRDKNNEASRKSRLNRKTRETQMQEQLVTLQQENQTLRIRADELEKLVNKLRESLVEIVKNPKR